MPRKNKNKNKTTNTIQKNDLLVVENTQINTALPIPTTDTKKTIPINNPILGFPIDNTIENFIFRGKGGKIRFVNYNNCSCCHENDPNEK